MMRAPLNHTLTNTHYSDPTVFRAIGCWRSRLSCATRQASAPLARWRGDRSRRTRRPTTARRDDRRGSLAPLRGLVAGRYAARRAFGATVLAAAATRGRCARARLRSEEHTSELQSLMRISYAVFCLKKKKTQ